MIRLLWDLAFRTRTTTNILHKASPDSFSYLSCCWNSHTERVILVRHERLLCPHLLLICHMIFMFSCLLLD